MAIAPRYSQLVLAMRACARRVLRPRGTSPNCADNLQRRPQIAARGEFIAARANLLAFYCLHGGCSWWGDSRKSDINHCYIYKIDLLNEDIKGEFGTAIQLLVGPFTFTRGNYQREVALHFDGPNRNLNPTFDLNTLLNACYDIWKPISYLC